MIKIPINRLEEVLSGRNLTTVEEGFIEGASTDSRKIAPGELFIPLIGEHFNGHDFIPDAIENGAGAIVSERHPEELGLDVETLNKKGVAFVLTSSVMRAMRRLAAFNRDRSGIPVVAVTGSSGKTTTKDLIASVLEQKLKVHKTQGNLNNVFGVPQTIIGIDEDDEIAVIEMGMENLGDIEESIRFVKPQIAVITNIGVAHLETLLTQENILKAKSEILATLTDKDTAILNGDDELLNTIEPTPFKIMRYGINGTGLNLKAENITSTNEGIGFNIGDEYYSFRFPGRHNIYNALCAVGIAKMFGFDHDTIQKGLDSFEPSDHRLNIHDINGIKLIDDTYNANPDSVKAALNTLHDYAAEGSRKIAVLGDMLELGEDTLNGHLEVGRETARQADYLIGIGDSSQNIVRGAIEVRAGMRGQYFKTIEPAIEFLKEFLEPNDIVLFKASHAMNFDKIIDELIAYNAK